MTHNKADDPGPHPQQAKSGSNADVNPLGLEALQQIWASWIEALAKTKAAGFAGDSALWPQAMPDDLAGGLMAEGLQKWTQALAQDPVLHSIDGMWNANPLREVVPVDWAEIVRSLRTVWVRSLSDPERAVASFGEMNARLVQSAMEIWGEAARKWAGVAGVDAPRGTATAAGDKRFAAPEWQGNPAYRTLKEIYLLASDWLLKQDEFGDMDEAEQRRLQFHLRQFVDAMSPTLLLMSNPEVLRRAIETGGSSLADGARNLAEDLKQGRLSMADTTAFALGENMAMTPGNVVHRNRLMELIQYEPQSTRVHKIPLLILPPWINKYYILDLQPKNSLIRYLVEQGFTVFVISWKNPDAAMENTTIEDYMDLGPLEASDVIRDITGSETVNVMGYCIAGTLLALVLAYLAAKQDTRFGSATFMVSLLDFKRVGDTAVFIGEESVDFIEEQMLERGYLGGREMSNMFNLLRSNDLIWANVINNYLLGQKPPAFDLLYWNADSTRMARAAHSWYLRNTYKENNLIQPGRITLKGEKIDLGRIVQPVYAVGAEKDHIVPWDAAWRITQLLGENVRFVLVSSGHIAGIINPPGGKGAYWTTKSNKEAVSAEEWRKTATRYDGSWWTDWAAWLAEHSGAKRKLPFRGGDSHPSLQPAPGSYVLEK
jgi:polyhydroxyalkanoate synthase